MVGAAGLIEEHIPVGPAHRTVVEIVDQGFAVVLPPVPLPEVFRLVGKVAALGEDEIGLRKGLLHPFDVFKGVVHVPVESHSPDVAGRFGIVEHCTGALVEEIAVVVPDDQFFAAHARPGQGRSEMILDKVALLLIGVDAGLPGLGGHGLVLHRETPHRQALLLVGLDELYIAAGPGLKTLGFEFAAAQHVVVGFHPGRRAPGAGVEGEGTPGRGRGLFDEGKLELSIMVDVETFQLEVSGLDIVVAAA
ncbi:MAG: hypothetical protein BWY77_01812 [bacterium ADurb.Bin431]|nr:MAG: hypothetical protein BWY77_01812 [bacterium ADurb.Bin431]